MGARGARGTSSPRDSGFFIVLTLASTSCSGLRRPRLCPVLSSGRSTFSQPFFNGCPIPTFCKKTSVTRKSKSSASNARTSNATCPRRRQPTAPDRQPCEPGSRPPAPKGSRPRTPNARGGAANQPLLQTKAAMASEPVQMMSPSASTRRFADRDQYRRPSGTLDPDFAMCFKRTASAVQRCQNQRKRRSRGRDRVGASLPKSAETALARPRPGRLAGTRARASRKKKSQKSARASR